LERARFAEMNGAVLDPGFDPSAAKLQINRWILTELTRTASEVKTAIDQYKFNEASSAAYRFVWNQFCDWYLELLKPVFNGEDEAAKVEARPVQPMCWRKSSSCCIRSCRS
jgi:valyl-tRNA synthetase